MKKIYLSLLALSCCFASCDKNENEKGCYEFTSKTTTSVTDVKPTVVTLKNTQCDLTKEEAGKVAELASVTSTTTVNGITAIVKTVCTFKFVE